MQLSNIQQVEGFSSLHNNPQEVQACMSQMHLQETLAMWILQLQFLRIPMEIVYLLQRELDHTTFLLLSMRKTGLSCWQRSWSIAYKWLQWKWWMWEHRSLISVLLLSDIELHICHLYILLRMMMLGLQLRPQRHLVLRILSHNLENFLEKRKVTRSQWRNLLWISV